MKQSVYREPTLSRCVYFCRRCCFLVRDILKKIKKVWRQRAEYLTADHWSGLKSRKPVTDVHPGGKTLSSAESSEIKRQNEKSQTVAGLSVNFTGKLAVYTCIFGPYDMIREPLYKSPYCDYFIITDQDVPARSAWKKIDPVFPDEAKDWPNAVKNRYFKMHPEVFLENYDYSIYLDGNIKLLTDMYPYVALLNDGFLGLYNHPISDCFYWCSSFLERLELVPSDVNKAQVESYRNEGFPEHFGYFECSLIIRKHNDARCLRVMDTWWEQYLRWVKRDQQCLMYSLWKNGFQASDVVCLGPNLRRTERLKFYEHNVKHRMVV